MPREPGEWMHLNDDDQLFLFGPEQDFPHEAEQLVPRAFKRVAADSGMGRRLGDFGISLDDLPDNAYTVTAQVISPLHRLDKISETVDFAHELVSMFTEGYRNDVRFEMSSRRWLRDRCRLSGYVPADAGSLRWPMATLLMSPHGAPRTPDERSIAEARVTESVAAAYAYLGTPHFVPADIAVEVATATPPVPARRSEIRLPARYAWIFHDGIPLSVVAGDDDTLEDYQGGRRHLLSAEALLLGVLMAATDDLAVDDLAFLIVARPLRNGRYGWLPIPVPMTAGARAAEVIWNYAGLLSWEDWKSPPRSPGRRKRESNRAHTRRVHRSKQAQQGAYHGVRVLDYRAPDAPAAKKRPAGTGKQLQYRQERRGYWKYRMRVGIRDADDRLVGPVYKDGAIEGVTFERRTKFIRPLTVREDLPAKPGTTVYRVPRNVQRQRSSSR
ncbi:hypothetical protein [Actinomadura violacea]|uniref:Uncharacterized protein n=1 Tax=Actinomadura violacea TaxID=2819934 RepID=A0ABS3RXL6_9ACTN|nr:hypothetical protein [Actinomadura violacea]MBO2461506.1 hypothetical protein [Actinomadura violacea]